MGQLRTSIVNLQKMIVNNPIKLDGLQKALEPGSLRIEELSRTADHGWDLMFMHLTNKFKKTGSTTSANAGKKLSEVIDSELATLVKGIDQWKKDLMTLAVKFGKDFDNGIKAIGTDLDAAAAEAKKLRAVADKKKSKWLASPKYKAKIKGYLAVIDDIEKIIDAQKKDLAKAKGLSFDEAWVNKWFTVKVDMTVKDIQDRAGMDVQNIMKAYLANQKQADSYVRKWRDEYKGMAGQLAAMKKWTEDADEMESES
ncbi:MAG: hypothetical protein ACM3N6_03255 [Betaproteobacteria bacterium]